MLDSNASACTSSRSYDRDVKPNNSLEDAEYTKRPKNLLRPQMPWHVTALWRADPRTQDLVWTPWAANIPDEQRYSRGQLVYFLAVQTVTSDSNSQSAAVLALPIAGDRSRDLKILGLANVSLDDRGLRSL